MKFQHYKYITLIYFFFGIVLFAGTDGTIRGKVQNLEGESLIGAQIFIEDLETPASANVFGIICCNICKCALEAISGTTPPNF